LKFIMVLFFCPSPQARCGSGACSIASWRLRKVLIQWRIPKSGVTYSPFILWAETLIYVVREQSFTLDTEWPIYNTASVLRDKMYLQYDLWFSIGMCLEKKRHFELLVQILRSGIVWSSQSLPACFISEMT
jgi:hypothetical protein